MAYDADDPTKYEFGIATYDATNSQLDRTDGGVDLSSNANNRVNFEKADGSHGKVIVLGVDKAGLTEIT